MARLIEKGVDDLDWRRADARYYRGWTPLFAAVSAGSADCTRFLLGALADVDCVTAAGSTPLIEAAARGHVEIVTLLLQAGAETQAEAADRRLGSARALALANGHKECADLIDDCESKRAAAADAAKQEQGPEKAAALAATEIVERDGLQTAARERRSRQLWEAASQGDDVTLHTLLGEGADPNFRQRQSYYRAPLAAASLRGHSTCVAGPHRRQSTHRLAVGRRPHRADGGGRPGEGSRRRVPHPQRRDHLARRPHRPLRRGPREAEGVHRFA